MTRRTTRIRLEELDRDRFLLLGRILDEVLDLPPSEHAGALDRLCAGDPGLRTHAEALLTADRDARDFLQIPPADVSREPRSAAGEGSAEGDLSGARIGPWRLLRELGRGGMGRVYLAERADGQFEQTVAIKLLKRGLDTDEILARFVRERQILAGLEHPNIARLLDGGVTSEGLPWFALEYVEGEPITDHGERLGLSLPEVLRLFCQAGRAVQFAHRNLIVHRDLKPGNILASRTGTVKLLDFGIAKLLDPADRAEPTTSLSWLMTPVYAAPEQIRGEVPTTATDVYALGIVLYELLTGERAYRKTRTPAQVREAVLEEIPETPSGRLRSATGRRGGWAKLVRGDLDNMVLKAVRKEPNERYATAEALVDDVERYLDGRPVRASGRRAAYVARKFIRRNRIGVAAAALALLALAGGLLATAWQARVAARERDWALLEAKKANEIKDFTIGLFQVSDPSQSLGAQITARDLLARGTERVDRELTGQPLVQAEMLQVLARTYHALGEYAPAESLALRSVEIARRTPGPNDEQLAACLQWLGIAQREEADYGRARTTFAEALAIRRAHGGERQRSYAETLGELASVYRREGSLDSAEVLYRRALAIDEAVLGPVNADVATDLDNLGVLLSDEKKYAEAAEMNRRAIAIYERVEGPDHPQTANAVMNLGFSTWKLGRYPEAESCYTAAARIWTKTLGSNHIDLASVYANHAELKQDLGDYPAAFTLYEKALAIERRALGPDHPEVSQDLNNLAILYYQRAQYPLALSSFREALAIRRKTLPVEDRGCLTMENNIGCVLREMGRYADAERYLRDTRERRVRTLGANDPDVATTDHQLGILLYREGRDLESERRLRSALAVRTATSGDSGLLTAQTAEALATLLRDEGRYRESRTLYERAVAINAKVFPKPSPQTADAWVGLGRLDLLTSRPQQAEPLLRNAFSIRQRIYGPNDLRTAQATAALGLCLEALGHGAQADSLLASALPVLERAPHTRDPLAAQSRAALTKLQASS